MLIIPSRCMGRCSSHFFAGDQKPRLQGGSKNRELSFCAPQVMKRNCTGLWTVLFCPEESILWRCILLWLCSDALCQKTRSHPVVWGRGPPLNVNTEAGLCSGHFHCSQVCWSLQHGGRLGAGREVPGRDPSANPKSRDT